ncbi:hypothetical protein [uncultured Paludibaculum sp.]|uniref:hypothetical protein n=1 Tax=uncultured Paludibaculum sp. TaxID=1765020 RepID=UPI002AAA9091|nr:hypothetical protein [uncultured Paludibaculum sp.]
MAVILFIAYALFSSGTTTSAPPSAPTATPAASAAEAARPDLKEEGDLACLDVPPPLRPACRQLTPARTVSGEIYSNRIAGTAKFGNRPAPPVCKATGKPWECQPWVERAHTSLKVAVSLVPDPEMTRLALYYGRTIDSIILAAGRSDFLFDSYWVPWKAPGSRTAADTAKGAPPLVPAGLDTPATLPGALLFRQSSASWEPADHNSKGAYLLVLLVGESNISGMRRDQFAEALYYLHTLTPSATDIPILGPNYSGTFASLHKCLREDHQAFSTHTYRIVSSNTTVKEARRQMRASDLKVRLTAIQRDDESTMNALLNGVDGLGRIATLSEGDTAFGSAEISQWKKKGPVPRITRISFPRGIAQLRDVYPEDAPAKSSGGGSTQATEQLPLSLRGSPAGSDTPESFNVKHLTVAQEAQMQTIAGILNRGGFETAFIFASDVLDLTFVTGYLRQSCPNLRVIVQDWDLLFLQTTSKWSMDGVWVLASLLPPPQNLFAPERPGSGLPNYWTPLLASSQFEHATYDAAYTIISELFPPRCPSPAATAASAGKGCPDEHSRTAMTSMEEEEREPIWLSVVGRKSLWPIGELGTTVQAPESPTTPNTGADPLLSGRLSRLTALLVCTVLGLAALYQLLILYSLIHPRLPRRLFGISLPRPFRSFRWWDEGFEGRVGYHSLGVLLLGCMSYVLTAPFAHWRIERLPIASFDSAGLVLCLLSLVFATLGGLRLLWPTIQKLTTKTRAIEPPTRSLSSWLFTGNPRIPLLAAIVTANSVGLLFLSYWQQVVGDPATLRSHFLGLRALDAFSGVSPSLPVLLLGCGFLTLAWTQMSRHELYLRVRPDIPEVFPQITTAFHSAGPAVGPLSIVLFLSVALFTAYVLFHLFERQSFDGPKFDHLYLSGLSVLWAALVTAVVRLHWLWGPLQCLLLTLERAPLRRAFTALPTEFSSSPLLPSSRRQDHRIMLIRSLDTLRAFAAETKSTALAAQIAQALPHLGRNVNRYVCREAQAHPCAGQYFRRVQSALAEQAKSIAQSLGPAWSKGASVKEGGEVLSKEVSLGEEFLALRFLAVIRYSVAQLWCQIWFLALGFFFAVLSTTAYPFRSQGSIRWMTNLFLAILGIPVLFVVLKAERNSILRRLSSNPEGKSGSQLMPLLMRLIVLGALPLLGVINSYVPLLGRFLSTWIEPLASVPK